jgi:hypothetical protein
MSSGAFDDAYYASGGTGALYVCGSLPGTARQATLWKVDLSGGSFASKTEGPRLVSNDSNDGCSPTTVFKNGSEEFLFASVNANASAAGGSGCTQTAGCMYSYELTALAGGYSATSSTTKFNSAADRYMSVSTSTGLNTTEATVQTTVSAAQAGTYSGMSITQGANTPGSTVFTYTFRKGGVSQSLTCAIGAGASTCSDTTNSVALSAGDLIDVLIVRTGAGNLETTFGVQLSGTGLGWSSTILATAALNATGGTGGIIIDNSLGGGGSQIYFATRTSGNAVQATQKALK